MKSFFFLIFFYCYFINIAFAENLSYVDLNYILNNSIAGKNIINKLNQINNKNLSLLKDEQDKIDNEKENIEKTKNILSKEELDIKILSFNKKLQKLKQQQDIMSREFNNLRQVEMTNLLKKINPIIEKYMIDKNIDLILKKENIIISKNEYDITIELMQIIDQNLKE